MGENNTGKELKLLKTHENTNGEHQIYQNELFVKYIIIRNNI